MSIRNIIFDMGNVLLRFDRDVFYDRFQIPAEDRPVLTREIFLSLEWARMDRGSMTEAEALESICQRLPQRLHETAKRLICHWDEPLFPIEGMFELVAELKELGYGIYLLSNASVRQPEYWARLPVSQFFDGTLISANVKLVKPQFEIYHKLLDTFGLKPEECFFVDDAIGNIEGAFCCGISGAVFHMDVEELRRNLNAAGVPVKM